MFAYNKLICSWKMSPADLVYSCLPIRNLFLRKYATFSSAVENIIDDEDELLYFLTGLLYWLLSSVDFQVLVKRHLSSKLFTCTQPVVALSVCSQSWCLLLCVRRKIKYCRRSVRGWWRCRTRGWVSWSISACEDVDNINTGSGKFCHVLHSYPPHASVSLAGWSSHTGWSCTNVNLSRAAFSCSLLPYSLDKCLHIKPRDGSRVRAGWYSSQRRLSLTLVVSRFAWSLLPRAVSSSW